MGYGKDEGCQDMVSCQVSLSKRKMSVTRMKKKACLRAVMIILSLMFCACQAPPVWERQDPEIVLKGFLQSADAQRTDLVWNYLGDHTRDILQQKADALNQRFMGVMSRQPEDMLRFGHVMSSTREYKKIELVRQDESVAIVRIVRHDAPGLDIEMRNENGRWAIDLPL